MSLDVFWKWLKTQLFELRSGGHSTSWAQSRKRSVRVIWYLFGMAPQGVVHLQNASFWKAHKFELASLGILVQRQLWSCRQTAVRVVFNEPKKAHVTPLFIRLHWLPIAARIKFKVLMFAYKTTTGAAPIYLNLLVQTYAPSRSLCSASERRLVVPSQRGTKSLSRTFSWTVPSWWNDLPISIRTAESLAIFKKHLKTHLFRQHLTN